MEVTGFPLQLEGMQQAQALAMNPNSSLRSSYRSDFCHRHDAKLVMSGGVLSPNSKGGMDSWSPASTAQETLSPTASAFSSTYSSLCSDRGDTKASLPEYNRSKSRKNNSLVPLGSLKKNSIISAPRRWQPFDTKGQTTGRGGLHDEEIMALGKSLCVNPHPACQLNAQDCFIAGTSATPKSISQSSWNVGVHSRKEEERMGGRSYLKNGDKRWHDCRSHAAYELDVHVWPRNQPKVARLNPLTRASTAPGRTLVFGQDLQSYGL